MKSAVMIIAAFVLAASAASAQTHEQSAKAQKPATVQKAALYTCPMHPEVTSTKPGICPKCKMELVRQEKSAIPVQASLKKNAPANKQQTKPAGRKAEAAKDTAGKNAPEKAAVLYTCPMHPDVVSDKPGQCPRCKMDLVKKNNDK